MPAMAAQQAPKTPHKASGAKNTQTKTKRVKEKLHALPQAAGVAIMALLLAVSLFVGNFRALQSATPRDFIRQGDVASILEDRVDAAKNVLTLARRAGLEDSFILEAEAAAEDLEAAKSAREISRADQALSAAVSELTTADMPAQEAAYMLRAADDFAEQGSFLRQEARAYNEKAEKAEALYERLPTKFVLRQPDVYEGI